MSSYRIIGHDDGQRENNLVYVGSGVERVGAFCPVSLIKCLLCTHSVETRMTSVTNVIVLGTWLETVLEIAAIPEQHHLVAGNILVHSVSVLFQLV